LFSLQNKNTNNFWTTWNKKVCEKATPIPKIEGTNSQAEAVNLLKTYFETLSNNVDKSFESNMSQKVNSLLSDRAVTGNCNNMIDITTGKSVFNITLIELSVSKLHFGAALIYSLSKQHFEKAHPVLYDILAKLFHLMFTIGYVSDALGWV